MFYVNIHVMGVFNTLYSVAYLFQYITRDVIVCCFDAILFLSLFIITYYYFCMINFVFCFCFVCLIVCLFVCCFFSFFFSCLSFFWGVLGFVVRWWGGKTLLYINKFLAYWLMVIFSFFCCTLLAFYALWGRGELLRNL